MYPTSSKNNCQMETEINSGIRDQERIWTMGRRTRKKTKTRYMIRQTQKLIQMSTNLRERKQTGDRVTTIGMNEKGCMRGKARQGEVIHEVLA